MKTVGGTQLSNYGYANGAVADATNTDDVTTQLSLARRRRSSAVKPNLAVSSALSASSELGDAKTVNVDAEKEIVAEVNIEQISLSQSKSVGNDQEEDRVVLKKDVGIWSGVSLIVGSIIGSGIFISPKVVASGSGSVALSLINWAICGVVSLGGALCFAEMGSFIVESGGEYSYLKRSLGEAVTFLFAWVSVLLIRPCETAIIAITCSQYILTLAFDGDGCGTPPGSIIRLLGCAVVVFLCAINCYSVQLALRIQVFFTVAKVTALIAIIIGGLVVLAKGNTQNLATGFQGTSTDVGHIVLSLYGGMWAYDGWNNLNYVVEELRNPHRDLPRSILIAMPTVISIYILVNISYFTVLPFDELLASTAVASSWAKHLIPSVQWIIPLVVAMSTFGSCNGSLFSIGRLNYVAARDGNTLEIFSMVHVRRFTPLPSLVFTTALAIIYISTGEPGSLIEFFSFAVWSFYGLAMVALIVMRFKEPHKSAKRPYKVPMVVAVLILLASVAIVLIPLVLTPRLEFLYAFLCIVSGLIAYFPFVYVKRQLPFMRHVTCFLQLFWQVTPAESANALIG